MTYGVLGAALAGLSEFMPNGSDWQQDPMMFQVNDGEWGAMRVGFVDPDRRNCIYFGIMKGLTLTVRAKEVRQGKMILAAS